MIIDLVDAGKARRNLMGNGKAGDGEVYLDDHRLSMNFMIQPEVVKPFLTNEELRSLALHARFLIIAPEPMAHTRRYNGDDDFTAEWSAIDAYSKMIFALLKSAQFKCDSDGSVPHALRAVGVDPPALSLSRAARAAVKRYHEEVTPNSAPGERYGGHMKEVALKTLERATRIAGILTVVERTGDLEISGTVMDRAISIAHWFLEEARRYYLLVSEAPETEHERQILEWIRSAIEDPDAKWKPTPTQPDGWLITKDDMKRGRMSCGRTKPRKSTRSLRWPTLFRRERWRQPESQRRRLTFRNSPAMRSSTGTLKYKDHPMARMTGGEAIVDSLLRHGIDTVFGLPGVQTYGLFDAFARASNSLRLINARHEQTTAYMALGYACATGRPSAYAVVPGPGVLNTGAALATAWGVNAPVLCLTGQVPSMMIGRGRGQLHELPDQLATLRSLLKWVERIEHPARPRASPRAPSRRCCPAAPAPSRWKCPGTSSPPPPRSPRRSRSPCTRSRSPTPSASPPWRSCWTRPRRRCCGRRRRPHASRIRALAAHIDAPVVSFRSGRGIIDDRSPLSMTVASAYKLSPETDLLVAFGTRLEFRPPAGRVARRLKIARIDIDPVEIRPSRPTSRSLQTVPTPPAPWRPLPNRAATPPAPRPLRRPRRTPHGNPESAAADVVPGRDPRRAARVRHILRRDDPGRLCLLVRPADMRRAR